MTLTATLPAPRLGTVEVGPVTQANVIRSEWIKLRSLRSTVLVAALTVVLVVGFGLLVSSVTESRWNTFGGPKGFHPDVIRHSLVGVNIAQLSAGVLGVLVITGEYTTGMIRATLGAVPARLPVIWAKAIVFAVVTFVISLFASLVAFLGGQAIFGPHGVSLGYPGALRAVFGVALYLTVVGLLGLAIGFIIRSTAGSIATLFGVLLVLPGIVDAFPSDWQAKIAPYLPSTAGQAVYNTERVSNMMHPWPGFALFVGYTVLAFVIAAVTLRRRDA